MKNKIHSFARRRARLVGVVAALAMMQFSSIAHAQTAVESLRRFFSDVKTYSARFDQVVLDETLNIIEESGGDMWISRPGKFRWNYAPPVQQEIVSNGSQVWLYDIDLEQVTERQLTEAVGRTPAILLAGRDDIGNNHDIRDLGQQGTLAWVGLKPTYAEAQFTDVRIGFEGNAIRVMELVDGLGQTTRITLSASQENPSLDASTFQFKAPPGVDVVKEDA